MAFFIIEKYVTKRTTTSAKLSTKYHAKAWWRYLGLLTYFAHTSYLLIYSPKEKRSHNELHNAASFTKEVASLKSFSNNCHLYLTTGLVDEFYPYMERSKFLSPQLDGRKYLEVLFQVSSLCPPFKESIMRNLPILSGKLVAWLYSCNHASFSKLQWYHKQDNASWFVLVLNSSRIKIWR